MRSLKIERMGEVVQGVTLRGDKRNPEPEHFRVVFPGGDVEVVRTTDGDYWVHVRVDSEQDCIDVPGRTPGIITDARLDIRDKHTSESNIGDFADPNLYHLAVRVKH